MSQWQFLKRTSEVTPEQVKKHLHTIHSHTIHALENIPSIKEFAHIVIEVLTYIYEQSTARLHPLFRPYSEALLKVFLHLEQSFAGSASLSDASGYFNFLHQYVALQDVPFSGTPLRGLQVLGLLETRSLHFDDVYFLNVNDDVLPGGIGSDMLLPQQLREKLGLETRHDRDKLSEYYFHLLVRGANMCICSFPNPARATRAGSLSNCFGSVKSATRLSSSEQIHSDSTIPA